MFMIMSYNIPLKG